MAKRIMERCQGYTKSGNRCKKNAKPNERFCSLHNDQMQKDVIPPTFKRLYSILERLLAWLKGNLIITFLIPLATLLLMIFFNTPYWGNLKQNWELDSRLEQADRFAGRCDFRKAIELSETVKSDSIASGSVEREFSARRQLFSNYLSVYDYKNALDQVGPYSLEFVKKLPKSERFVAARAIADHHYYSEDYPKSTSFIEMAKEVANSKNELAQLHIREFKVAMRSRPDFVPEMEEKKLLEALGIDFEYMAYINLAYSVLYRDHDAALIYAEKADDYRKDWCPEYRFYTKAAIFDVLQQKDDLSVLEGKVEDLVSLDLEHPGFKAMAMYRKALLQNKKHQWKLSLSTLSEAKNLSSNLPNVDRRIIYTRLSKLQFNLHQNCAATAKMAFSLAPRNLNSWERVKLKEQEALCYRDEGKYSDTVNSYTDAIELRNNLDSEGKYYRHFEAGMCSALLNLDLNRFETDSVCRKLISDINAKSDALSISLKVRLFVQQGKTEDAQKLIDKALERKTAFQADWTIYFLTEKGRYELNAGDLVSAKNVFVEAQELAKDSRWKTNDSYIARKLGEIAIEEKQYFEAIEYLKYASDNARENQKYGELIRSLHLLIKPALSVWDVDILCNASKEALDESLKNNWIDWAFTSAEYHMICLNLHDDKSGKDQLFKKLKSIPNLSEVGEYKVEAIFLSSLLSSGKYFTFEKRFQKYLGLSVPEGSSYVRTALLINTLSKLNVFSDETKSKISNELCLQAKSEDDRLLNGMCIISKYFQISESEFKRESKFWMAKQAPNNEAEAYAMISLQAMMQGLSSSSQQEFEQIMSVYKNRTGEMGLQ